VKESRYFTDFFIHKPVAATVLSLLIVLFGVKSILMLSVREYPFIQTADVKDAQLYIDSYSATYNDLGLAQSKLWPARTLCITIAANIADTAILDFPACFPDSIIGFIADETKVNVKYVKYFYSLFQRNLQKISQGAAQDNLNLENMILLKIPAIYDFLLLHFHSINHYLRDDLEIKRI